DETEICISSMDSLGYSLGVCDRDVQIDAWMGLAKRLDAWRQPIICDGLAGCQGQRAALEASQIVQDLRRSLGARHNLACLVQEIAAGLGQHDAAADAVKQLDPVTRFQRRD